MITNTVVIVNQNLCILLHLNFASVGEKTIYSTVCMEFT